jgi:hypothetical protein
MELPATVPPGSLEYVLFSDERFSGNNTRSEQQYDDKFLREQRKVLTTLL